MKSKINFYFISQSDVFLGDLLDELKDQFNVIDYDFDNWIDTPKEEKYLCVTIELDEKIPQNVIKEIAVIARQEGISDVHGEFAYYDFECEMGYFHMRDNENEVTFKLSDYDYELYNKVWTHEPQETKTTNYSNECKNPILIPNKALKDILELNELLQPMTYWQAKSKFSNDGSLIREIDGPDPSMDINFNSIAATISCVCISQPKITSVEYYNN